ncbi:MAG: ion channel [Novosphingobium sp.]
MAEPQQNPFSARSAVTTAMKRAGPLRIRPLGMKSALWHDLYHELMRLTWPRLALLFATCFLAFNLAFAALYRLDPAGLAVPHDPASIPLFWRDFFFSVHTVATIGYGNVYPVSAYANWVVVIEITLGILFFALTTGIVFARFSRPTGRILFSQTLVVREIDGVPTLMLRAANQRHNLIYSAEVKASVLEDAMVGDTRMRRFSDLKLVREANPVFALSWTVMHAIDGDSPLRSWLDDRSRVGNSEIIVVLSGFDEESGQIVHGRWAYACEDIRWNAKFADIISIDDTGMRTIDYTRFHEVSEL